MDVKISNVLTRFAFSIPSLRDDLDVDDHAGCGVGASSDDESTQNIGDVAHGCVADRRDTSKYPTGAASGCQWSRSRTRVSELPRDEPGLTGAYSFVDDGGASSASSPIPGCGPARNGRITHLTARTPHGAASTRGDAVCSGVSLHLPDLMQLAARLWNVELHRGPTGTASHCVLRPPPYVINNVLHRGPVVQVFASGVVRMMTHGSVAATKVLAQRVHDELHEACVPLAVRRAAREESLLLRAVLGDSGAGVVGEVNDNDGPPGSSYAAVPKAGSQQPINGHKINLGTSFSRDASAGDPPRQKTSVDSLGSRRMLTLADGRAGRGQRMSSSAPTPSSALSQMSLTIDFLQAVAVPRWDEIAALRASLLSTASASDADESGLGPKEDVRISKKKTGVAVHRASVNVRGDAPMEWWRWYLDVQTDDCCTSQSCSLATDARGDKTLPGDPADLLSRNDPLQPTSRGFVAAEEGDATGRHPNKSRGFWTCAGLANASPAVAAKFVSFLRRRRALLAQHTVTYRLRRQAGQNSLHILLDWRTTTPTRSPPRFTAAATHINAAPAAAAVSLAEPSPPTRPLIVQRPLEVSLAPLDSSTPSGLAAAPKGPTGTRPWVIEASAAQFFMESTFIPESTVPYGMESVRVSMSQCEPTEPAGAAHETLGDARMESSIGDTAMTLDSGGHDRMSALPEDDRSRPVLRHESINGGLVCVKKTTRAKRSRGGAPLGTSPATGDKHAAAVEHVTCTIHRTGRAQLTASSEVALQQICSLLLIPFLVATAEIV